MRLGAFVLTYNRPEALAASIAAIMGQTRPPDLLCIVDNGDPRTDCGGDRELR